MTEDQVEAIVRRVVREEILRLATGLETHGRSSGHSGASSQAPIRNGWDLAYAIRESMIRLAK